MDWPQLLPLKEGQSLWFFTYHLSYPLHGVRTDFICSFFYNKMFSKVFSDGDLVAKSCPTLATPWTVTYQALLSMGLPRQEYWSGLPFPSPGDLPDPRIESRSLALQADSLPTEPSWKSKVFSTSTLRRISCPHVHKAVGVMHRIMEVGLIIWRFLLTDHLSSNPFLLGGWW